MLWGVVSILLVTGRWADIRCVYSRWEGFLIVTIWPFVIIPYIADKVITELIEENRETKEGTE